LKRKEKENALVENLKSRANLSKAEIEKVENVLVEKFGSIYDAFSEVSAKGKSVLENLSMPPKALAVIEELSSKIQVPHVEIRGILELTCTKPNGIDRKSTRLNSSHGSISYAVFCLQNKDNY